MPEPVTARIQKGGLQTFQPPRTLTGSPIGTLRAFRTRRDLQ